MGGGVNFDPDQISDDRVRRAFQYWDSLRDGREMPMRTDIDPEAITPILPFVLLVDVLEDPLDFRFRLAGTDVVDRYGQELTGHRLSEIDVDGQYEAIFAEYRLTVDRRKPELFTESFCRDDGRYVSYARLLCPLSKDGWRIDMLFGVQVALSRSHLPSPTGVHRI